MGAVTKEVFGRVTDHFFGRTRESSIIIKPETIREDQRAEELFKQALSKTKEIKKIQDVYEDMKHPAFKEAQIDKEVFEEAGKIFGDKEAVKYWNNLRGTYLASYQEKLDVIDKALHSDLTKLCPHTWKETARLVAKEDPDSIIKLLHEIKSEKNYEKIYKLKEELQL